MKDGIPQTIGELSIHLDMKFLELTEHMNTRLDEIQEDQNRWFLKIDRNTMSQNARIEALEHRVEMLERAS